MSRDSRAEESRGDRSRARGGAALGRGGFGAGTRCGGRSRAHIKRRCARLFSLLGISPGDVVAKMEEATYYNASAIFSPFLTFSDVPGYSNFAGSYLKKWNLDSDKDITVSGVFQARPGMNALSVPMGNFVFL